MRRIKDILRQWPLLVTLWRSLHHTKSRLQKRLFRPHPERLYGLDLRQGELQPLTKRALLSYKTTPFSLSPDDPRNVQFSNIGIIRNIVRVLNELGYTIDVVNYQDTRFLPSRNYDLFIGHAGYNFERIERNLPSHVDKIYFSSGIYWREFNRAVERRFRQLEQRRGIRLPYERWIHHSEEYANQSADGIICLGNEVTKKTYSQFPVVVNMNNAAYPIEHYDCTKKDFASARSNFLFFSGSGNVHKGLDLLLESFSHLEEHLYVCQRISPEFYEFYQHELKDYPNIHLVGYIPMRGAEFYKLVDKCAFVIHPSCAEGQPGSVVDCMHQGLIPVVSRACALDIDDYGVMLDPCTIEEIRGVVQRLSTLPAAQCREMSMRAREAAVTDFSESAFRQNFTDAIQHVLCVVRE